MQLTATSASDEYNCLLTAPRGGMPALLEIVFRLIRAYRFSLLLCGAKLHDGCDHAMRNRRILLEERGRSDDLGDSIANRWSVREAFNGEFKLQREALLNTS